ncbi:MAG: carboxypeptidase-like regulatory domain-containing protein [Bacteroidales bacterium]|nr:carboxypeptidase-like regulatory domain-containing protein [Bacteroidales bacterium]
MKRILSIIIICFAFVNTYAQTFQGNIYYKKQNGTTEPLPFAQVYYLEKSKLLEADADGTFKLKITEKSTLVATYVGYTRDTVVAMPGMTQADFYLSGENEVAESVITARQPGNTLSKLSSVRTEVITAAGLCKMACCNLAESFENSASVTVGYSDAITGARQIKLLGLSGTYTQMLDENRPVMRGLASPFGLSYIPGQWLESIQIAKGPSSVINGLEAVTGQINMEHRKPTAENPLFVNLYVGNDTKLEANVASSLQLNEKWSTVILGHVSSELATFDHNEDGFRDEPKTIQFNLANRWLYYAPSGVQVRFGIRALSDDRVGGQMNFTKTTDRFTSGLWGSRIQNKGMNGYVKVGVPLNADNSQNVALVADYTYHRFDSFFGLKDYNGKQNSVFLNLLYQNDINDAHKIEFGITGQHDNFDELMGEHFPALSIIGSSDDYKYTIDPSRIENSIGAFGEYTYRLGDKLTFVGGARLDYNNLQGWLFAPRANVKYSMLDNKVILRASGGRGFRSSNIFVDNLGMFSTGRTVKVDDNLDLGEDAWTYGGNITVYMPFGYENNTYLSFDFFRNEFVSQIIVDQERDARYVWLYNLDGKSYTNTYQIDFSVDPVERFNIVATFRYTDAKVTLSGHGLVERPLTSRYKAVLNMQYSTNMSKWIFDFTAQLNGPMKLPNFMDMEYSPVYPVLFAQVTRKFRSVDVYIGGENLTNYRQHDAIIAADRPFSTDFNASAIWGPLMGIKVYAGMRLTLWK